MKHKKWIVLNIILFIMITSCTVTPSETIDDSGIEVINFQTTPALAHWLPNLAVCADIIPNFGIYTQILPLSELNLNEADLILRLGEKLETDPNIAVMGIEEIVVFVGNGVPLTELDIEQLQLIFEGTVDRWELVPEISDQALDVNQPILTLSYPDGHALRQLFSRSYLESRPVISNPQVFTSPVRLETILNSNPYAIGYGLKSQLPESIQTLTITNFDSARAKHTVLAITQAEPEGNLLQLLLCLQNSR